MDDIVCFPFFQNLECRKMFDKTIMFFSNIAVDSIIFGVVRQCSCQRTFVFEFASTSTFIDNRDMILIDIDYIYYNGILGLYDDT